MHTHRHSVDHTFQNTTRNKQSVSQRASGSNAILPHPRPRVRTFRKEKKTHLNIVWFREKPSNHHNGRSPKTPTAFASRRTSLRKNQLSTYDKNATTNTTHRTRTRVSDIRAKRKKTSCRAPSQRRASVIPTCLKSNYARDATEDETCLPTSVVS